MPSEKHTLNGREIVPVPMTGLTRRAYRDPCMGCIGERDPFACLSLPDCNGIVWHWKEEQPDD